MFILIYFFVDAVCANLYSYIQCCVYFSSRGYAWSLWPGGLDFRHEHLHSPTSNSWFKLTIGTSAHCYCHMTLTDAITFHIFFANNQLTRLSIYSISKLSRAVAVGSIYSCIVICISIQRYQSTFDLWSLLFACCDVKHTTVPIAVIIELI